MKLYKADNELAEILFKHGFIDATSEIDKAKGDIRRFKTCMASHKVIKFDFGVIKIIRSNTEFWRKYEISEEELKALLFYFKAISQYYREFYTYDYFNFDEFQERLLSLRKEVEVKRKSNKALSRLKKKQGILDFYDGIII